MKALRFYSSIIRCVSQKRGVVVVLLLVIPLFNMIIFPFIVSKGALQPHDIMLYYSPRDLIEYIRGLSPSQKVVSLVFHATADIIYPFLYTLLLSILLFLTLTGRGINKNSRTMKSLIFMPLTIFFLDLMENTGMIILVILSKPETPLPGIIAIITSEATTLKWIGAGLTIVILMITFLLFLLHKLKRRPQNP